jgi:transcriptional regulator
LPIPPPANSAAADCSAGGRPDARGGLATGGRAAPHGYGIAQAIRANSSDVLQVDTGSLYPALHRLERQKLVAAAWKVSDNKQRTRVYCLTRKGRAHLTSHRSRWAQFVDAVAGILNAPQPE